MKLVSFDLETTGLDPNEDQVLHVAAVIEDTEHPEVRVDDLPTFECIVYHERVVGHPIAMQMNAELLGVIGRASVDQVDYRGRSVLLRTHWEPYLIDWLDNHFLDDAEPLTKPPKFVACGKNVGSFDLQFMSGAVRKRFHHRVVDVGQVAMGVNADLWLRDTPPSMTDLGFEPTHDALDDARDSIEALRTLTNNYGRGT